MVGVCNSATSLYESGQGYQMFPPPKRWASCIGVMRALNKPNILKIPIRETETERKGKTRLKSLPLIGLRKATNRI